MADWGDVIGDVVAHKGDVVANLDRYDGSLGRWGSSLGRCGVVDLWGDVMAHYLEML